MSGITKYGAIFLTVLGLVVASGARADTLFLFSDDFSTQFNIERGQTNAKFSSGRFYVADDSVSSSVASDVIANPSKAIVSARLDVNASAPSSTVIIYYVSNNGGSRWKQVNPGYTYPFDSVGNELRWKVALTRESPVITSPYLDSINLTYTVSDSITPSAPVSFGGGSLTSFNYATDVNNFVCNALSSLGLGCGRGTPGAYQPGSTTGSAGILGSVFGSGSTLAPALTPADNNNNNTEKTSSANASGSALTAAIYTAGQKQEGSDSVNLARVKGKEEIYEIVGGKKHLIPTKDIFYDYGFKLEWVQDVTQQQLDKFPRVKLMQVSGNKKKTYYFTEGGMVRLVPEKNVLNSYGNREEDVIIISKKEFNFYPQNQFVFLESPLTRGVYQLIDGGKGKRYLTASAVKRMKIDPEQVAPVNQAELTYYKTYKPIVL